MESTDVSQGLAPCKQRKPRGIQETQLEGEESTISPSGAGQTESALMVSYRKMLLAPSGPPSAPQPPAATIAAQPPLWSSLAPGKLRVNLP